MLRLIPCIAPGTSGLYGDDHYFFCDPVPRVGFAMACLASGHFSLCRLGLLWVNTLVTASSGIVLPIRGTTVERPHLLHEKSLVKTPSICGRATTAFLASRPTWKEGVVSWTWLAVLVCYRWWKKAAFDVCGLLGGNGLSMALLCCQSATNASIMARNMEDKSIAPHNWMSKFWMKHVWLHNS